MRIHETIAESGGPVQTRLIPSDGQLAIQEGDGPCYRISPGFLESVMKRYGRPLEPDVVPTVFRDGERLSLPNDRQLYHFRYRPQVDAIARDYLVWVEPRNEPLAVLSGSAAAALLHLARASDKPATT